MLFYDPVVLVSGADFRVENVRVNPDTIVTDPQADVAIIRKVMITLSKRRR